MASVFVPMPAGTRWEIRKKRDPPGRRTGNAVLPSNRYHGAIRADVIQVTTASGNNNGRGAGGVGSIAAHVCAARWHEARESDRARKKSEHQVAHRGAGALQSGRYR